MIKLSEQLNDKRRCLLCPNFCVLSKGQRGMCLARRFDPEKGDIVLDTYGIISAMAVEPIEKKPITHFIPGTKTLSLGSFGCSLNCDFCENSKISQSKWKSRKKYSPNKIVDLAKKYDCKSICMTYNEPSISFEFLIDLANAAHDASLKFVLNTNGYVNSEPWIEICRVTDAMNIDYKGTEEQYKKIAKAKKSVFEERIREAYDSSVHVEVSIPIYDSFCDDIRSLFVLGYFLSTISENIPCHLLTVYPAYRYINKPVTSKLNLSLSRNILSFYMNYVD
jgi:pyruvate formate lyase activating enzyme